MVAKKKVVKVTTGARPELDPEKLWQITNDLESLACKFGCLGNVAELLAANIAIEPESGVAWAMVDMVKTYTEEIDKISGRCMELHRNLKELE